MRLLLNRHVLSGLAIAALTTTVYGASLDNPFQYDDLHCIAENLNLRSLVIRMRLAGEQARAQEAFDSVLALVPEYGLTHMGVALLALGEREPEKVVSFLGQELIDVPCYAEAQRCARVKRRTQPQPWATVSGGSTPVGSRSRQFR